MRFIPKHMGVRVLAVILAFLLWVHVVTDKEYEYTVELPLKITGIQDDLMLVSHPPETCELKVRGSGKQLLRFLVEVEDVSVDAADYSTGLYIVDVVPEDLIVNYKSAVEIVEVVSPTQLRLQFEERMEKAISVKPEIEVTPALGYIKEGDLRIDPDTVILIGPKNSVRKINSISTEQVSYTDIRSNLSELIRLSLPDSADLTLSDSTVLVEQDIVELKERTFSGIPVSARGVDAHARYTVIPESISVTVEAPQKVLDSISADQFEVLVDIGAAGPGSTFVAPKVTFPKGLRAVDIKPNEILIEVPRE